MEHPELESLRDPALTCSECHNRSFEEYLSQNIKELHILLPKWRVFSSPFCFHFKGKREEPPLRMPSCSKKTQKPTGLLQLLCLAFLCRTGRCHVSVPRDPAVTSRYPSNVS